MNAVNQVSQAATQAVAEKYITPERMVAVIVEPMDEEERERREAAAHKDSRSDQVKSITQLKIQTATSHYTRRKKSHKR